jgi:hypothetical protein
MYGSHGRLYRAIQLWRPSSCLNASHVGKHTTLVANSSKSIHTTTLHMGTEADRSSVNIRRHIPNLSDVRYARKDSGSAPTLLGTSWLDIV